MIVGDLTLTLVLVLGAVQVNGVDVGRVPLLLGFSLAALVLFFRAIAFVRAVPATAIAKETP
jgi:hypothetical protein